MVTDNDINRRQKLLAAASMKNAPSGEFIIMDIDGTVTVDRFGYLVESFWPDSNSLHQNCKEFLDKVDKEGVAIIYVTARSFSKYNKTAKLLFEINELPKGPILMSPYKVLAGNIKGEFMHVLNNKETNLQWLSETAEQLGVICIGAFGDTRWDLENYKKHFPKGKKLVVHEDGTIYVCHHNKWHSTSYWDLIQRDWKILADKSDHGRNECCE